MKKITPMKPLRKIIGLFTILYLYSLEALAQSSGFGTPSDSDMSVQFLGQIFGGLVGGGQDAFGSSIATFNSAVLIVGGLLVGYTIFAGTLGTAHDGEMLGKKFSSVWVPIRTVLGTALVLPVMKGGYCTMQALVMWLVLQGISLANMVWTSYAGSAASNNLRPAIASHVDTNAVGFVINTYAVAACVAAQKKADDETRSVMNYLKPPQWEIYESPISQIFDGLGSQKPKRFWGGNNSLPSFDFKACGYIIYPDKTTSEQDNTNQGTNNQAQTNKLGSIAKLQSYNITPNTKPIYDAHIAQSDLVRTKSLEIATAALGIDDSGASTSPKVKAMETAYNQAINAAAQGVVKEVQNTLTQAAESEGWFTAGTFASKIIIAQNEINAAIAATGEAGSNPVYTTNGAGVANKDALSKYITRTRGFLEYWGSADDRSKQPTNSSGNSSAHTGTSNNTEWSLNYWILKFCSGLDFNHLQSDDRHPILVAQEMGLGMINAAVLLESGSIGSAFGAAWLETEIILGNKAPSPMTSVLPMIATWLQLPVTMLMATGAMLAYAVPMTPFFLWIGIIIGWTLMVVEAILAAPLWAVMHLHPYGDDMTGKGGSGYMLVLGLVVRPALIIFGLIAAITLSGLFGQYLNAVFLSSFVAPKTLLGVITTLMMGVIYTTILLNIIKTTFSLMHQIPDQLLRWIGGGSEQLGQFASTFGPMAMEKASAVAGGVIGATGQAGTAGAKGLGDYRRGQNEFKKKEDAEIKQSEGAMDEAQTKMANEGMDPETAQHIGNDHNTNDNGDKTGRTGFETQGAQKAVNEAISINSALKQIDPALAKNVNDEYNNLRRSGVGHNDATTASLQKGIDDKFGPGAAEKMGVISSFMGRNVPNLAQVRQLGATVAAHADHMKYAGVPPSQISSIVSSGISGSDGSTGSMSYNIEAGYAEWRADNTTEPPPPPPLETDQSGGNTEGEN